MQIKLYLSKKEIKVKEKCFKTIDIRKMRQFYFLWAICILSNKELAQIGRCNWYLNLFIILTSGVFKLATF